MDKKLWKDKTSSDDVVDAVVKAVGFAKLKQAKESFKGEDLRAWAKLQIDFHGPKGITTGMKNRAATKIIDKMHEISRSR